MPIELAELSDSFNSDSDEAGVQLPPSRIDKPIGAPLEPINPLGTEIRFSSAMFVPLSSMLGMGVVSTPGVVVQVVGSLGLSFLLWIFGSLVTFCGLGLYMELASRFPGRSGGDAVFLEQAYPRPRYMVATVFGIFIAMRYTAAVTATVFAEYSMHALDVPVTPWRQKSLAVAMVTLGLGLCAVSTRWSLKLVNTLAGVKLVSMAFIICTGLAVLSGMTRIEHPLENLRNPFTGSQWGANALATGYLKVDYTFAGWNQAIVFLSEVHSQQKHGHCNASSAMSFDTIRRASYVAVALASVIYLFINLAFFAVLPIAILSRSDSLAGVLFCENVFGKGSLVATQAFPLMVALSCVGGMMGSTLAQARMLRETARQGVLPYPKLLSSTWPLGTPLGPLAVQWILNVLVILVPSASESFSFLVSMHMYPMNVFNTLTAVGIWNLRAQSPTVQPTTEAFRASNVFVFIYSAKSFLSVVMPWIPPRNGSQSGTPGIWYATYCLAGLSIISIGLIYYSSWMWVLPKLGGYNIVQETVPLEGGAFTNTFKKVPKKEEGNARSRDDEALEPLMDG